MIQSDSGLIRTSEARQNFKLIAAALVSVPLVVITGFFYLNWQRASFAIRNLELAVSSAQKLVDQIGTSFEHGDINVNAANDMLKVAKRIVDEVHKVDPTVEATERLVRLQQTVSDIYSELQDYGLAHENARNAKNLAESFRAINAHNPKALQFIYGSIWRMGDADARQGKREDALKEYREAQVLAHQLAAQAPGDAIRQRELMFIDQKIGDLQQALGNIDGAITTYRTALNVIEEVHAADPKNRNWRREVATTRRRMGLALSARGDFDAAMDELRAAVELLNELAREDPTDNITQSNLASNHRDLAIVYARHKDWAEAAAEYQLAITSQGTLIARDPSNATWQNSMALFRAGIAEVFKEQNELGSALDQYRQAYDIRKQFARKDPRNPDRQDHLAKAAMAIAAVLQMQKQNLEEAVKLYREAIDIQDEVLPRHDDDVFDCYIKIGDIRLVLGDRENAFTEYTRAWSIAHDFTVEEPSSVKWKRNLLTSHTKIGDVLKQEERAREALEQQQIALEIATALAVKEPNNTEWPNQVEILKVKIRALTPP